ncbi:DAK2 domain-containing protein [Corynebacterium poyangense]|uniref:DAK2 domain-containing protein n=1 Tax=Corynebacterium poyangense TaxID=2684405 RepID=A0A7H0SNK7_9CORY|nr:DAK2 domain-containing protein [Corynebacterium poyangense]QNQ90132.1 DAK2 domain-containing protein [Corynebacterium poyangense]
MTASNVLNATVLHNWMGRALSELNARRAEINQLNVFPVPDSDTGSNMAHTIAAAHANLPEHPEDIAGSAAALAQGAVRGARGNSGLVLSQVLRGLAQAASDGEIDSHTVSQALNTALALVNKAIAEPVEGTVITVLRAAAIAAQEATDQHRSLVQTVRAARDAARTALAATPSQLAVLQEAGVVDAGGRGLVILLETLLDELKGTPLPSFPASDVEESVGAPPEASTEIEVMFQIVGADVDELASRLKPLGNSLVIGESRIDDSAKNSTYDAPATVHIHSAEAGKVIELAFAAGKVSNLKLEVLPAHRVTTPQRLLLAIAQANTVGDLYAAAGAEVIAPSKDVASDIIATVRRQGATEVILLPNGLLSRRELISVEKAGHAFSQSISLIPTRHLVEGIAALAVHDPQAPLGVATYNMTEAASSMKTAIISKADQAALTNAGAVSRGDYLANCGDEVIVVGEALSEVIAHTVRELASQTGGELLTLLAHPSVLHANFLTDLRSHLGRYSDIETVLYPAHGLNCVAEVGVE